MASFASSATTHGGARKHAWTNYKLFNLESVRPKEKLFLIFMTCLRDLEFSVFLSTSTVWDCKNIHKIARLEGQQNAAKITVISPPRNKLSNYK